jgi:hypothetical protein
VTLFDKDSDTLDIPNQKKYFKYLSETGLAGLVILGTNAEAFLLTREERTQLIVAAREAVGPEFPLMAGVSESFSCFRFYGQVDALLLSSISNLDDSLNGIPEVGGVLDRF